MDDTRQTQPEVLALILARGGSKSVPRKNITPINGKPLIAYTILQALASQSITRTIVSTDDEEIAEISREWGAETPFMRPADISGDNSVDFEALFQEAHSQRRRVRGGYFGRRA